MFSVMELRLIRYSVQTSIQTLLQRRATADPESDEAVEITNDLMIYQNILDKISDRPELCGRVKNWSDGMYPAVKEVTHGDDYTLSVIFGNGQKGHLDMKPVLDFGVFQRIKAYEVQAGPGFVRYD